MDVPDAVHGYTRYHAAGVNLPWPVYRQGDGPAVILIHELLGLTPDVITFADRVRDAGYTVYLPVLFGAVPANTKLRQSLAAVQCCISREITMLATGRTSRVVTPLRELARAIANPQVGVIGMCASGGFALALAATEPTRIAVAAQPVLPFAVTPGCARDLGLSPDDVDALQARLSTGDVEIYLARFGADKVSPAARLEALQERVGRKGVHCDVIPSGPGTPFKANAHSVLTLAPRQYPSGPAHDRLETAIQQVIDFLGRLRPQ
jgi:dienelactone hydrolase